MTSKVLDMDGSTSKNSKEKGTQSNGYVSELNKELNETLNLVVLPEMSKTDEQCIYKVPQLIRQTNPKAYTPQIISIGPFHNPHCSNGDNDNLIEMEELKLKYLKGFLNRTKLCVNDLVFKLQESENRIRSCDAGVVRFGSKDFLKLILVDACFIIEHFLRVFRYTDWEENDPILLKPGLYDDINRDLILIENQLPFFVLEEIYNNVANIDPKLPSSFITIIVPYFHEFDNQNLNLQSIESPKHFTDLLRTFLLPSSFDEEESKLSNPNDEEELLYSVSQLSEAGLKFELSESKCLLDLKFDRGVLKMPCLTVHDDTERFMRNILAFEECHISDRDATYISQYLTILDFLINSEKDVSILVRKKIIVNWMGDANEVATMVNTIGKIVAMPRLNQKFVDLFHGLNGFYEDPINKYKAIFVHEYFNTPWKIASTITAILLVLFTLIQAVCSIWSLV